MGLPLVAVGLMYRHGYFRQRIDALRLAARVLGRDRPRPRARRARSPATTASRSPCTVPIGEREVVAQIWRVDVGRVPLLLLDADRPGERPHRPLDHVAALRRRRRHAARPVRAARHRRRAGAARARHRPGRRAPQRGPRGARLPRARARRARGRRRLARGRVRGRAPADRASPPTRRCRRATTPTRPRRWRETLAGIAAELGVDADDARAPRPHAPRRGRRAVRRDAVRAARRAGSPTASARRHGEVAREMWHDLWPDRPVDDVPITHVTNGAHIPTWIGAPDARAARPPPRRGLDRPRGRPATWEPLDAIPDAELWAARGAQRARADRRRARAQRRCDRLGRGDTAEYVRAAVDGARPGHAHDRLRAPRRHLQAARPAAARRRPRARAARRRGAAGPADPGRQGAPEGRRRQAARAAAVRDEGATSRSAAASSTSTTTTSRSGAAMVRGCDVWVNVPRPPLEASGTSGIKSAHERRPAAVACSTAGGRRRTTARNGWAISGEVDHDHGAQDWRHAAELYRLLSDEVVPTFYDRDADGAAAALARRWCALAAHDRARASAPAGWCATTPSGSTRRDVVARA